MLAFVGSVVGQDQVDVGSFLHFVVQLAEEAKELPMAVVRHGSIDHGALEHIDPSPLVSILEQSVELRFNRAGATDAIRLEAGILSGADRCPVDQHVRVVVRVFDPPSLARHMSLVAAQTARRR